MNERVRMHVRTWNSVRPLERERLLILLSQALEHLPTHQVESLLSEHGIYAPPPLGENNSLLGAVENFCKEARDGVYFQEWWAKGKHGSYLPSPKTEEFGAKLTLLLDLCVAEVGEGDPKEVCDAYERLLGLLQEIDRFERDDIVFWADEPGTWQLGINWARVLPSYLLSLSKILPPEDVAKRTSALMKSLNPLDASKLRPLVTELVETPRAAPIDNNQG